MLYTLYAMNSFVIARNLNDLYEISKQSLLFG